MIHPFSSSIEFPIIPFEVNVMSICMKFHAKFSAPHSTTLDWIGKYQNPSIDFVLKLSPFQQCNHNRFSIPTNQKCEEG